MSARVSDYTVELYIEWHLPGEELPREIARDLQDARRAVRNMLKCWPLGVDKIYRNALRALLPEGEQDA